MHSIRHYVIRNGSLILKQDAAAVEGPMRKISAYKSVQSNTDGSWFDDRIKEMKMHYQSIIEEYQAKITALQSQLAEKEVSYLKRPTLQIPQIPQNWNLCKTISLSIQNSCSNFQDQLKYQVSQMSSRSWNNKDQKENRIRLSLSTETSNKNSMEKFDSSGLKKRLDRSECLTECLTQCLTQNVKIFLEPQQHEQNSMAEYEQFIEFLLQRQKRILSEVQNLQISRDQQIEEICAHYQQLLRQAQKQQNSSLFLADL